MVTSVLITGGGSGIGAATARALSRRGCNVIISGRRVDALQAVAAAASNISICVGDVTDAAHRDELAERLGAMRGPRALVHTAGHFQTGLLDSLTASDWDTSFETNVSARWKLSRNCLDLLVDGRLLFVGSDSGANPRAGAAAYSVAQAASETLRRALHAEWSPRGVAVAGFKPGLVDTDMVRRFMAKPLEEFPSRSVYDACVARGEIADPDTVGAFAAWLLLDVATPRFSGTEWDIRTPDHREEWHVGPLYQPAR